MSQTQDEEKNQKRKRLAREIKWTPEYNRRMARERARWPEKKARRRAKRDEQERTGAVQAFDVFCANQEARIARKLNMVTREHRVADGTLDFRRDGDIVVERRQ